MAKVEIKIYDAFYMLHHHYLWGTTKLLFFASSSQLGTVKRAWSDTSFRRFLLPTGRLFPFYRQLRKIRLKSSVISRWTTGIPFFCFSLAKRSRSFSIREFTFLSFLNKSIPVRAKAGDARNPILR